MKNKTKVKKSPFWFLIALVVPIMAAPNTTLIRVAVNDADPYFWAFTRFAIAAVCIAPFAIRGFDRLRRRLDARRYLLYASILLAIDAPVFSLAVYHSQASYVSILTLLTPVLFVIFSALLVREKITRRSIAGVTLAAIGGMVLVVVPIAVAQDGVGFYPLATVLAIIDDICYALALVYFRKANEAGASMAQVIGVTSLAGAVSGGVLFAVAGDWTRLPLESMSYWLVAGYSSVGIIIIASALGTLSYEKVGSAVTSALTYFGTFLAILLPVFVLGERLSPEMAIGGVIILVGVYIAEHKGRGRFRTKHHTIHHRH